MLKEWRMKCPVCSDEIAVRESGPLAGWFITREIHLCATCGTRGRFVVMGDGEPTELVLPDLDLDSLTKHAVCMRSGMACGDLAEVLIDRDAARSRVSELEAIDRVERRT